MFIVIGIILIAAGFVVRKFWPHKQGSVEYWIISIGCSEWLSLMIYGVMFMFFGILLTWVGVMGKAPWL